MCYVTLYASWYELAWALFRCLYTFEMVEIHGYYTLVRDVGNTVLVACFK